MGLHLKGSMMPHDAFDFDACFADVHALGLAHLRLLSGASQSLRAQMADAQTADDVFVFTHHLLALSAEQFRWSQYLVPKEPPGYEEAEEACAECAEEEAKDEE